MVRNYLEQVEVEDIQILLKKEEFSMKDIKLPGLGGGYSNPSEERGDI